MTDSPKTHYRKVFKSDYLGVADLEDWLEEKHDLIFTVTNVKQEFDVRVAGKKGNFNIAYFSDCPKPLVLNAGNSKIMKSLAGGSCFVEDWKNITIQLYIDKTAKFGGTVTGGVRINTVSPKREKPEIIPGHSRWEDAKKAFVRDNNFDKVLERAVISEENMKLIKDEVEQHNEKK